MSTSTDLTIRTADPLADRDAILAVLERNLPEAASRARHDWLYLSNPAGPARVWLAEDGAGEPVGTSAAHPRRMRVHGEPVPGLNLSDFAFDTAFRSVGPALQLLRATLEPVRAGEFELSYDFPSASMHALYRRLKARGLGGNERRVLPVRVGAWARKRFGLPGGILGAAMDAGLSLRDSIRSRIHGFTVEPLEGAFGSEFDEWTDTEGAFRGVRDRTYLQWRYGANPLWRHETLVCRREGALLGYAVVRSDDSGPSTLLELESDGTSGVRQALVVGLCVRAHRRRAQSVQVETLAGSAAAAVLGSLGFRKRDEGPGVVPFGGPEAAASDWWITGGDRDQ